MALKFVEHFLWIAASMVHVGDDDGMWDEEDGFFYDVLRLPDGRAAAAEGALDGRACCRCARSPSSTASCSSKYPEIGAALAAVPRGAARADGRSSTIRPSAGTAAAGCASVLNETKLRRVLARMLDENEFLSPYGIRSLSRYHAEHPYVFHVGRPGVPGRRTCRPSPTRGMFGGNSNWRGPIWMPVNALIIRALLQYYTYYGDDFTVECPTGSGQQMTLYEVAEELARRLTSIFLRDERRPAAGLRRHARSSRTIRTGAIYILFYEYFHGDNGAGLGASHQTGWTGVVARIMHLFATTHAGAVARARQGRPCARKSSRLPRPAAAPAATARGLKWRRPPPIPRSIRSTRASG